MDLLFLGIVFGLVFGSQAYNALKLFIFPEHYRGFYNLKFGLWLMCVLLEGFAIYKLWWLVFVIGSVHLITFVRFVTHGNKHSYLATPLHPGGKLNEEKSGEQKNN